MSGQIKGITIEYSGNTTKLEGALRKVQASTKAIDKELKAVNSDLKFNPGNSDLLARKQQILKDKIEMTANSLKSFRDIQRQLEAKGVDKTSREYLKVRQNIIAAESKLRTFNAQLARTRMQKMTNLGNGFQTVGQKLTNATRYARRFAVALGAIALWKGFERLKSLDETETQMKALGYRGEKLTKIMEATKGSVDGTRFMLQDMAKVATGALGSGVTSKYSLNDYLRRTADLAQLTGMGVEEMGSIMNKAYSKGRVDARLLNQFNQRGIPIYKLLQKELGVTAEELTEMTRKGQVGFDDLYKATDRYDGLAQKMGTNTLSGAATVLTQQFGLAGAEFLEGVYEPIKTGVQGIVAWMKRLRNDGTFKAWGEALGQTVKYFIDYFQKGEDSMAGMSDKAKGLATGLSPIVKTIGAIVQWLAKLPPSVQGGLGAFVLFGGPVITVLGKIITGASQLSANMMTMKLNADAGVGVFGKLAGAMGGATGAMAVYGGAIAAGVGWLAAIAIEYNKAKKAQTQYTDSVKEWKKSQQESIDTAEGSTAELEIYQSKLQEVMDKEHKSAGDKQLIKTYVDKLNGSIEGLNLKYDEEKDKLNKTTTAIKDRIEAMKQSAIAAAYEEQVRSGATKLLELEQKEKDIRTAITKENEKYAANSQKTAAVTSAHKQKLAELNGQLKNNKTAQTEVNKAIEQSATAAANLSPKMQAEWSKMVARAKKAGIDIPSGLKKGIQDGSVSVPTSMNALYQALNPKYAEMVKKARDNGIKIPRGLKAGIDKGKLSPQQAAAKLEKVVNNKLAKGPGDARKEGRSTGSGYGSGISSKKKPVGTAAEGLKDKAAAKMDTDTKSGPFYRSGQNAAKGYQNGISGKIADVARTAAKMVSDAVKAARKKQDESSPSKVFMKSGYYAARGYEIGMEKESRNVKRVASEMISGAIEEARVSASDFQVDLGAKISGDISRALTFSGQEQTKQQTVNQSIEINVDGSRDPSAVVDELITQLKLKARTNG